MINPINQTNVRTSIFYINDYHGKTLNMERTATAVTDFDVKLKNHPEIDTFKLSSGDIMIGVDDRVNEMAARFQSAIGVEASAIGNHEFDQHENISKYIPLMKYKLCADNLDIKNDSPWKLIISSSIIEEKNGHTYGIVGASPPDLFTRLKRGTTQQDIRVYDPEETITNIQKEVDKLKSKGINKIILLSHLGYELDIETAKQTSGIDVILGGHSHNLIKGINENQNLFYNKDSEPVIITQAGRDGKNFGVLNVEFDQNGIIKKAQNNVGYTKDFKRHLPLRNVFDHIFGENKIYGYVKETASPVSNDLIDPNPHAYFIVDCMRKNLDADIALMQSANLRGFFETGKVDSRIISDMLPFNNKLLKVNYSEKEIVDAINAGLTSFKHTDNKPGIFYTSGLKYTTNRNGELQELRFTDKNGVDHQIDIKNPRTDKYYATIINDYCAEGNDGFTMLCHPERTLQYYDFDAGKCIKDILSKTPENVTIKDDHRITII